MAVSPEFETFKLTDVVVGKGNQINELELPICFHLKIEFVLNSFPGAWTNLFHCGKVNGIRCPAIFIGKNRNLHCCIDSAHKNNLTWDYKPLETGKQYLVELKAKYQIMEVWINGDCVHTFETTRRRMVGTQPIWAGDPWHNQCPVDIHSLEISELTDGLDEPSSGKPLHDFLEYGDTEPLMCYKCTGTCGGATDRPWTCGNNDCPEHGKSLDHAPVIFKCSGCKPSTPNAYPGTCDVCNTTRGAYAWCDYCLQNGLDPQCTSCVKVICTKDLPSSNPAEWLYGDDSHPFYSRQAKMVPISQFAATIPDPQPVHSEWAGRKFVFNNIRFENTLWKQDTQTFLCKPGDTINLTCDWTAKWKHNSNDYCPGCVVQFYYGLGGVWCDGIVRSGIRNHGEKNQKKTFVAPEPGLYYFGWAITLMYDYVENKSVGNNVKNSWAALRVLAPHEDYSDYEDYLGNDFKELKNLVISSATYFDKNLIVEELLPFLAHPGIWTGPKLNTGESVESEESTFLGSRRLGKLKQQMMN